ncbi:MAG: hypothetical protein PHQ59_01230 [Candidatus Daviesbacteria bacterium]|nr:hypothetical protein [Candidatus Daviesbacteria bacterium]
MLKGFFSKEKIILGTLILVLLSLISFIFFRFQLTENGLVSAKGLYAGMQRSLSPSQAYITLDKDNLKIVFKITNADKQVFAEFLKSVGIKNFEEQEINIKFADQNGEELNKILRKNNLISDETTKVSLNLKILTKEIDFDNKKVFGPFDSVAENLLENPSDAGSIRTEALGGSGYLVEIDNPEKVLTEGTLSGKLKLSENLVDSGWWQVVTKLAKINLKIQDGVLTGAFILK